MFPLVLILNIISPSFLTEEQDLLFMYAFASLYCAALVGICIWIVVSIRRAKDTVRGFSEQIQANKKAKKKEKKKRKNMDGPNTPSFSLW